MKIITSLVVLWLGSVLSVRAQAVVTYYPFNSVVSVSTNSTKSVWCDFRVQTNSVLSSLNTEIAPMVQLSHTRNAVYYAGVGVNTSIVGKLLDQEDLLKGYFLSAGVRVRPFEKLQNVGVAFEASPYSAKNFKSGIFRTWLGLSYYFGGRKK